MKENKIVYTMAVPSWFSLCLFLSHMWKPPAICCSTYVLKEIQTPHTCIRLCNHIHTFAVYFQPKKAILVNADLYFVFARFAKYDVVALCLAIFIPLTAIVLTLVSVLPALGAPPLPDFGKPIKVSPWLSHKAWPSEWEYMFCNEMENFNPPALKVVTASYKR